MVEFISKGKEREILERTGKLHGHFCPFVALGVKAGVHAMRKIDAENKGMEEVLAIVETNNCFSDGIQYSTGCSFGNNSLIFRDIGKTAVTLVRRGEKGTRLSVKPDASEYWEEKFPEYSELFEKVVEKREGGEEDSKRMMELSEKISFEVIEGEPEEFFKEETVSVDLPEYAPIHESFQCEKCGESVMGSRAVEKDGKNLCISCAGEKFYELNGSGITKKE